MIGFTTLLENIKYTVTQGTSCGIYPPAVIIKALVVGAPHVTKIYEIHEIYETTLRNVVVSTMEPWCTTPFRTTLALTLLIHAFFHLLINFPIVVKCRTSYNFEDPCNQYDEISVLPSSWHYKQRRLSRSSFFPIRTMDFFSWNWAIT